MMKTEIHHFLGVVYFYEMYSDKGVVKIGPFLTLDEAERSLWSIE